MRRNDSSTTHVVRLRDVVAQPWRNNGGMTQQLLTWPRRDNALVRVSIATIDRSGPFSAFPGIERWFTVIEGTAVRLDMPDGPKTMAPGDEPMRFDGECAPHCHLLEGATRDLNLMVVRNAGSARMQRAAAGSEIDGRTQWRALYAAGAVLLEIDGVPETIGGGTLVWSEVDDATNWKLSSSSRPSSKGPAWWLTFRTR